MPLANPSAYRGQIGSFNNTLIAHQRPVENRRELGELLDVSNSSNFSPVGHTAQGMERISSGISIVQIDNRDQVTSSYGICKAAQRHPVVTGIVLTTAVLGVAGLASRSLLDSSSSLPKFSEVALQSGNPTVFDRGLVINDERPTDMPNAERLIMSDSDSSANVETVTSICEEVIGRFARMNGVQVDRISMNALRSIKIETGKMVGMAQSMAQDDKGGTRELARAARCSGVRLRHDTVGAMISRLEAMKSNLLEDVGISVDDPINVIRSQNQIIQIDKRISALQEISGDIYNAVTTINGKILRNMG